MTNSLFLHNAFIKNGCAYLSNFNKMLINKYYFLGMARLLHHVCSMNAGTGAWLLTEVTELDIRKDLRKDPEHRESFTQVIDLTLVGRFHLCNRQFKKNFFKGVMPLFKLAMPLYTN